MTTDATERLAVPLKLRGKKFLIAPGRDADRRAELKRLIEREGGQVVGAFRRGIDYVVVPEGPRLQPSAAERQAEKLRAAGSPVQTLDEGGLHELLKPTPDEARALLTGGEEGRQRWQDLWGRRRQQSQIDLSGLAFRGASLRGANLGWVVLDGCDFREADLRACQLAACKEARFDRARMNHASLAGGSDCSFEEAVLAGACLSGKFARCRFARADFTVNSPLSPHGSLLDGVILQECDFSQARLPRTYVLRGRVEDCSFRAADLTGCNLFESTFACCDFTAADLSEGRLEKADLSGSVLAGANLSRASLRGAKLTGADLRNADLREANLAGTDLRGALIDGARFEGTSLVRCDLEGLDLTRAVGVDNARRTGGGKGPSLTELDRLSGLARRLQITATILLSDRTVQLEITSHRGQWVSTHERAAISTSGSSAESISAAMLAFGEKWQRGRPDLDSVTVKARECPVKGKGLRALVVSAWCEAWGLPAAGAAGQGRQQRAGAHE